MKSEVKISGNRIQITRVSTLLVHLCLLGGRKRRSYSSGLAAAATKCEIEMDFRVGGWFTQKMLSPEQANFRLPPSTTKSSSRKGSLTTLIWPSHHASSREFFEQGNGQEWF